MPAGFGVRSYLQHVEESRLSGIIESQEQELGVLIEQSEGGQDVPDCGRNVSVNSWPHSI